VAEGRGKGTEIPWIPELADDYELVRELGRGGTAVVYLARDRELGRDVAIKLIRPAYVQDEDAVARLVREARTVGRLQHPGIVMLLGTRRLGERGLALILQYVPGETLKGRIQRTGPLPFPEVERVLRDLGNALEYAHAHRIVHRDIKPENVYLDEGSGIARLADFGLARGWDSDSGLTMPGTAIGTPTYMSPEQLEGGEIDGRSDIFSLGLVGYEAITGEQPWAGESLYSLIHKQKHEDLPPIRERRQDTPDHLIRAIEGAIAKDPADRWPRVRDFLNSLAGKVPGDVRATDRGRPVLSSGGAAVASTRLTKGQVASPASPETGSGVEMHGRPPGQAGKPSRRTGATPNQGRRPRRLAKLLAAAGAAVLAALFLLQTPDGFIHSGMSSVASFASGLLGWDAEPTLPGSAAGNDTGLGGGAIPPLDPFGTRPPESAGGSPEGPPSSPGGLAPTGPAGSADGSLPGLDGLTGTGAGAPISGFVALSGENQEATAGALLPVPVAVRVVDEDQLGIPGVPVEFAVVSGGGVVNPPRGVTGPDGSVLVQWQLGAAQGEQVIRARTETDDPMEITLAATALAPVPASAQIFAGQGQEGITGELVPNPLAVRVLDPAGRPVPGVPVRFGVTSGGGTLDAEELLTGPAGTVTVRWRLGSTPGSQSVLAEVEGLPPTSSISFVASARAPALAITPTVVVGGAHSCSLRGDGSLVCWGGNDQGQLGDGSRTGRIQITTPVPGGPFAHAASGLTHVCALAPDGSARCWGANDHGQLGGGPGTGGGGAVPVAGGEAFRRITAGSAHSCALTSEGAAYCWGANDSGQLGDGSRTSRNAPVRVSSNVSFREITAGWNHTCALSAEGIAFCWGANGSGQLGSATTAASAAPGPVPGGHRFRMLAAGNAHTCGVTDQGQVLCWGMNSSGQLGDGTLEDRALPLAIASGESFTAVAAGGVHSCALTQSGEALCWGRNLYGQIGDGTQVDRSSPTPVQTAARFAQLHSFGSHNCGRTTTGEVLCWGYNLDGQLGDGTRQNRGPPVTVPGARP